MRDEIKTKVIAAIKSVAPEASAAEIEAARSLREQLDIDSIDCLNFILKLHTLFGIAIPEADYSRFQTLDGAIDYILKKTEDRMGAEL